MIGCLSHLTLPDPAHAVGPCAGCAACRRVATHRLRDALLGLDALPLGARRDVVEAALADAPPDVRALVREAAR